MMLPTRIVFGNEIIEIAKENAMSNVFQDEIADLKNKLKDLISKSARVKKEILDKILLIPNNERREILIKRYLENKAVVTISKEMFMTYQGTVSYTHLTLPTT